MRSLFLFVLLVSFSFVRAQFMPGKVWLDEKGEVINAHGGGILYDHGKYYWFGEKRGGRGSQGVNVYSSADLYHWKFEGLALAPAADTASEIAFGCVMERPKVIYNPHTRKYVMWFHLELRGKGYSAARAAVAVSDAVTGPYTYVNSFRPNGNMSRDMTLFTDEDGAAYEIYSSRENYDMRVVRLSDDYLSVTTADSLIARDHQEAPAVFRHAGTYYMITSACTGWAPNKASLYVAKSMFGPWTRYGNPMRGENADLTFGGQSTYVLPVHGEYIFIGDRWNPKDLKDSRYLWLPMEWKGDSVVIPWRDEWNWGGARAEGNGLRWHVNFDEGWKFHLGNAADPAKDLNYGLNNIFSKSGHAPGTCIAPNYDDREWEGVQLPHDWAVSLPFQYVHNGDLDAHGYRPVGGLFPENSIGWYRKRFFLSRADSGRRYAIQFDGIYRDSKVWVNGYYIGGHFSGYTGFGFDITDLLHFDAPNVIVVRADATQEEGWFYEGAGIYRHAFLNSYADVHVVPSGGVFVHSSTAGQTTGGGKTTGRDAVVTVETQVENQGINAADAVVAVALTDREGRVLARSKGAPLKLAVDASGSIVQVLKIRDAHLWSLGDPYLYRAFAIVSSGGHVVDSVCVRFGVRTITIDKDKGLFVNGVPVKVQGVSCHQDHAGMGSALPDYLQYYRISLLKEMGVNAYRTTHNAPTPELLDACDSLGMLVMDETRLLNSGAEYEGQLRELILRDRNHPSIFIWSVGNEEHATQRTDIGKRITQHQVLLQAQLDPTRTATYACNMGNVYRGVNEAIPVRGFNYNLRGIDPYRREHPDQPLIGTEMASTVSTRGIYIRDTVHAYVPDYDSVFPPWASTAETWWKVAADREWYMGGFAWTGFDYRGEPTPYQWPNINSHFGIMDMCGFPKTVYYYYQSWWTDKDVLHIAPHWNWKGKEGQPILVWVNTNADNVELFLNGRSLGKKDMPRNGHLTWNVLYEPGVLEAVAYKKGKKMVSRVETTGEAYRVVLTPARTALPADGSSATVLNVSVVDKEGREVPDAGNRMRFSVVGDAAIIGVGNGDPSCHEPDKCANEDWSRSLFNGKAQVILQAGHTKGTIIFKASGDGLVSGEVSLVSE